MKRKLDKMRSTMRKMVRKESKGGRIDIIKLKQYISRMVSKRIRENEEALRKGNKHKLYCNSNFLSGVSATMQRLERCMK